MLQRSTTLSDYAEWKKLNECEVFVKYNFLHSFPQNLVPIKVYLGLVLF